MATPPPKRILTLDDIPGAPKWVESLLGSLNGALKPTAEALSQALTFRENFAGEVKTVTVTPPDDWVDLTLATGWSEWNTGKPPQVMKTQDGWLKFRRLVKLPAVAPSQGVAFATLPATHLASTDVHESATSHNYAYAAVGIQGASLLLRNGGTFTASGWVALDGIDAIAADRTPPRWAAPVDVRLGTPQKPFPGRPGPVILLGARPTQDPSGPAVVTGWDITPISLERNKSAPGIRIHRVWGLVPGVAYTLTLLVLPE